VPSELFCGTLEATRFSARTLPPYHVLSALEISNTSHILQPTYFSPTCLNNEIPVISSANLSNVDMHPSATSKPELTFTKIPLELRQCVYDYLLLDKNVSYVEQRGKPENKSLGLQENGGPLCRQRLNFEVALFRVNKQISSESLKYFRSNNAFISIETMWSTSTLENIGGYAILMIIGNKWGQQKAGSYALTIRLTHVQPFGSHFDPFTFAITTARQFPSLVRLFNALYSQRSAFVCRGFRIRPIFNLQVDTFEGNTRAASQVLNSMKDLRGFYGSFWDDSKLTEEAREVLCSQVDIPQCPHPQRMPCRSDESKREGRAILQRRKIYGSAFRIRNSRTSIGNPPLEQ
jgi:hypothetical protein